MGNKRNSNSHKGGEWNGTTQSNAINEEKKIDERKKKYRKTNQLRIRCSHLF